MNHCLKKSVIFLLLLLIALLENSSLAKESRSSNPSEYESFYKELLNLKPDFKKSFPVDNFTLRRDAGVFTLKKGRIFLCKPLLNRVCAAVFKGEGNFKCTPPVKVEKEQLFRVFGKDSIDRDFNFLLIIFSDATLRDFYKNLKIETTEEEGSVENLLEYALKYIGDEDKKNIPPSMARTFLNYESNGLFYAHMSRKKYGPAFLYIRSFKQ